MYQSFINLENQSIPNLGNQMIYNIERQPFISNNQCLNINSIASKIFDAFFIDDSLKNKLKYFKSIRTAFQNRKNPLTEELCKADEKEIYLNESQNSMEYNCLSFEEKLILELMV